MRQRLSCGMLLGFFILLRCAAQETSAQPPEDDKAVPVEELIQQLKDEHYGTRYNAVFHLEKLGRQAQPAVPALVDALGDGGFFCGSNADFVFDMAARTLTTIGPPAIPALTAAVKHHPSLLVRNRALDVLGSMGAKAQAAVPTIQAALGTDELRVAAALALWQIDPEEHRAVSGAKSPLLTLIECLQHKNHEIRANAAFALVRIGPAAKEAIPALVVRLKDEDMTVRYASAMALAAMKSEGMPAVPALLEALQDKEYYVRYRVILALGEIGPHTTAAAIALGRELANSDDKNPTDVLRVLAGMGSDAEPVLPLLMDAIQSKDASCFEANVLGRIGPNARAAVPGLIRAMKDPDGQFRSNLRLSATQAVGRIGPGARDAIPSLIEALEDDWYEVQTTAVESLVQIGPDAVPALTAALRHPNRGVRKWAADALGGMGRPACQVIPALTEALKDEDDGVRTAAASALGKITPRTGKAAGGAASP